LDCLINFTVRRLAHRLSTDHLSLRKLAIGEAVHTDTDIGAAGAADRGNGLATNDSTAGAATTPARLTGQRFSVCSGSLRSHSIEAGYVAGSGRSALRPGRTAGFCPACQSELAAATAELQAAKLAVQLRALEIEKLKFQIAKLRRMQFGRSSERLTRHLEQLELRLEELEAG
jgi:hypothetical protein